MAKLMEKRTFVRSGEGAVASYDWSDLVTQSGYVAFYGLSAKVNSASTSLILLNRINPTEEVYTETKIPNMATPTPQTFTKSFDTLPLNASMDLKGTAFVKTKITFGGVTSSRSLKIYFYKVRGATATQIGYLDYGTLGASNEINLLMDIDLTKLIVDDKIRFSLEVTATGSTNGTNTFMIYHDPEDLAGTNDDLRILVPFKIDI
jgi:hypothetical protein